MNPNIAIAILLITFVLLIMIKCPITFSMIISTAFTMLYIQVPVMTLVQQMSKQLNSFSLLAIPFFILMGEIMAAGGISSRLPGLCKCMRGADNRRSGTCKCTGIHAVRRYLRFCHCRCVIPGSPGNTHDGGGWI